MEKIYIKQLPKVEEDGYYYPKVAYCEEGIESDYIKCISKEDFIKCYNKWIITSDLPSYDQYIERAMKATCYKSSPKFRCPKCGGNVRKDERTCLATFPPKHAYECDDCDFSVTLGF